MALETILSGRFHGRSRVAPRPRPPLELSGIIDAVDSISRTGRRGAEEPPGDSQALTPEISDLTLLPSRRPQTRAAFRVSASRSATPVVEHPSVACPPALVKPTRARKSKAVQQVKRTRPRRSKFRFVRPIVVGLVLLAAAIAWLFDIGSLVVRSDSMAGTYPAGSVTLTHEVPREEVKIGDVILVQRVGRVPVLHRVIELDNTGASPAVRTKGDANATGDSEPFVLPRRVRLAFFGIPSVGYVLSAILTPLGWMFMMVLPATLLTAAALRGIWMVEVVPRNTRARRLRRARKIRRACAWVFLVAALAVGVVKFGTWALSVFSDSPAVDANNFTTGIW